MSFHLICRRKPMTATDETLSEEVLISLNGTGRIKKQLAEMLENSIDPSSPRNFGKERSYRSMVLLYLIAKRKKGQNGARLPGNSSKWLFRKIPRKKTRLARLDLQSPIKSKIIQYILVQRSTSANIDDSLRLSRSMSLWI